MAEAWKRSLRHPRVIFGLAVFALLAIAAIFAPLLAPHSPLHQNLLNSFAPPFWHAGSLAGHPLGTDDLGRDTLSRVIYGARVALIVAVVSATLAGLIGTLLGLVAGYAGGATDTLVSRLVDVWMAFPPVLLSIVLVAVIGAGLEAVIVAIVVVDWTRFCRIVRAEVLVQREQDYVAAAVAIGAKPWRIVLGEILRNLVPTLIVLFTLEMGIAITVEAILSFVGLSIASGAPSWGGMIQEGRLYIHQAWWLMALPVGCIVVSVLGLNALGDGLRQTLDPLVRR